MAIISGNVFYDANRTGTATTPVSSVAIALQDINTGMFVAAETTPSGEFSFSGILSGTYNISVAWGIAGAAPSPVDFGSATWGQHINSATPPITAAPNPAPQATNLDFLSQSTYQVVYTGADITGLVFRLGPVIYTPMNIIPAGVVVDPENLLDDADEGTFGSFEQGSIINRGALPVPPYPGLVPDFTYTLPDPTVYIPNDGEYGIQNVMTDNRSNVLGSWWRVADKTTGNETGRFLICNGDNPGTSWFHTQVTVKPDTYYLFSGWFLNMFKAPGYEPPHFGVRVTNPNGEVVFYGKMDSEIPLRTDMPEWKELGAIIHTDDYTELIIEFLSEGPAAWGNDFCADDISLREIHIPNPEPPIIKIEKEADKYCLTKDKEVTFTIKVENESDEQISDIIFMDRFPCCLAFTQGTVEIDGLSQPTYDPSIGFKFDLTPHQATTIKFKAHAICYKPQGELTCNRAKVTYPYRIIEGGVPVEFVVVSEPACVYIARYYKDRHGDIWSLPKKGGSHE